MIQRYLVLYSEQFIKIKWLCLKQDKISANVLKKVIN